MEYLGELFLGIRQEIRGPNPLCAIYVPDHAKVVLRNADQVRKAMLLVMPALLGVFLDIGIEDEVIDWPQNVLCRYLLLFRHEPWPELLYLAVSELADILLSFLNLIFLWSPSSF